MSLPMTAVARNLTSARESARAAVRTFSAACAEDHPAVLNKANDGL